MRTIDDIPEEFRKGTTDGENIARLASGVQAFLLEKHGAQSGAAGLRFVQAGLHFRNSEIGREMSRRSLSLEAALGDSAQLVEFAGGVLAATSLAASIDLAAAGLYRLYFGQVEESDPGREADLHHFPRKADLPGPAKTWLQETKAAQSWRVLKAVRDHFVHRCFPIHVTVHVGSSGPHTQELEIEGRRHRVGHLLEETRAFVIDRLVSIGEVMVAVVQPG